jgi:hypothetical protein
MTMYYSEVDGTEPTISFSIKDTRYTLTNESLVKLVEEKESLKAELLDAERKFRSARYDVKEFFQARYETDHHEIVCEIDDVNELLKDIGSEQLTKSWSATVIITATVTGVEGPNKEAVEDIIKDSIDVNFTEDGDLWVDDITVDSVHAES